MTTLLHRLAVREGDALRHPLAGETSIVVDSAVMTGGERIVVVGSSIVGSSIVGSSVVVVVVDDVDFAVEGAALVPGGEHVHDHCAERLEVRAGSAPPRARSGSRHRATRRPSRPGRGTASGNRPMSCRAWSSRAAPARRRGLDRRSTAASTPRRTLRPRRARAPAGARHDEDDPMTNRGDTMRTTRIASAAAAVLAAGLLTSQDAEAQNLQRCRPPTTTHTVVVRLPGVKVAHQTCVITFGRTGQVKAWVHTLWRRTNFRTRFRQYTVQARLELRDVDDLRLRCRYADDINASTVGQRTCETTLRATNARGWTGDGRVVYRAGAGRRARGLAGSPPV
jgi:hypothetical protein